MDLKCLIDELSATNLCTFFILPLVGVNRLKFGGDANFLNSFLSKDGSLIYAEVYQTDFATRLNLPKHRVCLDANGKDYIEFTIPEQFQKDVELFMAGKYSKLSHIAKQIIREHSSLPYKVLKGTTYNTDVRLLALDKSNVLKEFWEAELWSHPSQSHLTSDMELLSKPDELSYLDTCLAYI